MPSKKLRARRAKVAKKEPVAAPQQPPQTLRQAERAAARATRRQLQRGTTQVALSISGDMPVARAYRDKPLPPQDVKCCTLDTRPGNAPPPSYELPDVTKEALSFAGLQ